MRRILKNLVSMTSLLSACVVLVVLVMAPSSTTRDALIAACLTWSMIADGLAGLLARRLADQRQRGTQLDALGGLIAFGVAPSLWMVGRHGIPLGAVVVVPAVLWIVVAAVVHAARLAVDDASGSGRSRVTSVGVPTPVATAALVCSVALGTARSQPLIEVAVLWAGVALMPSRVPYPTGGVGRWPWVVAVAAAVVALAHHAWR
jgi:phosphatidylserine synthase